MVPTISPRRDMDQTYPTTRKGHGTRTSTPYPRGHKNTCVAGGNNLFTDGSWWALWTIKLTSRCTIGRSKTNSHWAYVVRTLMHTIVDFIDKSRVV